MPLTNLDQFKPLLKEVSIIFCDIDGTLLNGESELDERTIVAVKHISKRIPFVLISGRSIPLMKPIHQALGLSTPLIGANGAILSDATGKTLHAFPMKQSDYLRLLEIGRTYPSVAINVYTLDKWYTNLKSNPHVQKEEKIVRQPALSCHDLSTLKEELITKIIFMGEKEILTDMHQMLEKELPQLRAYHNYANYIEVFDFQAEKGLALLRYIKSYPVENGSIMAIGDSLIDASMFDYAKIKVAMDNAPTLLKSKANILVKSNVEQGVAILLETMENL